MKIWNTTHNPPRWLVILGKRVAPGGFLVISKEEASLHKAYLMQMEAAGLLHLGERLPLWYEEERMKAFKIHKDVKVKLSSGEEMEITAGGVLGVNDEESKVVLSQLKKEEFSVVWEQDDAEIIEKKGKKEKKEEPQQKKNNNKKRK